MDIADTQAASSYPFPTTALRNWVIAFVVCNFNVDIGPEIELVYPETNFTQSDLSAICFNSFPDRQDGEVTDDLKFHFTLRNHSSLISGSDGSSIRKLDYFYGSCVFRQEADILAKRNFGQKTLVLVSHLDFPSLHLRILDLMTSTDFINNPDALEAACIQISAWKPPANGQLELPFFGSLLNVDM
ncbi:MAG: hypothetical protein M1819_005756 [Sarea resinae]|nr:MAG: hypothetical protein M1819_005756 [Sarea resinae]